MEIEPLSLEHQSLLQHRFASLQPCLSEYSFASRYLFRREHNFHVLIENQRIWLQGKTRDGIKYLMPTEDLRQIAPNELLEKFKWADCFYPIPESWLPSFAASHFRNSYTQDDSDYLYTREKIAEYPGRNLSAKRNLVKQFLESYQSKTVLYQKEHLKDALFILDEWQKKFEGVGTDHLACKDGLELSEQLNLLGYLVYVDENPAALILGEALSPRVFAIHFAKGLTQYKGIYPFLFKELATRLSHSQIIYLNWEQDLGQEGLRKSKLSYQPDKIAHKFRIFPN